MPFFLTSVFLTCKALAARISSSYSTLQCSAELQSCSTRSTNITRSCACIKCKNDPRSPRVDSAEHVRTLNTNAAARIYPRSRSSGKSSTSVFEQSSSIEYEWPIYWYSKCFISQRSIWQASESASASRMVVHKL